MLCFADVDGHVLASVVFSDHHSGVDLGTGFDEEGTPVLKPKDAVRNGAASLHSDKGAFAALGKLPSVGLIAVQILMHDARTSGLGQQLVAETEKASGGDSEFDSRPVCPG